MPEVRRSKTRASGRGEQPDALLERRLVSFRLARDHALQPHDSKDWTHPHCCFHATIHGLTELSIFNNITMLQLRTTVTVFKFESNGETIAKAMVHRKVLFTKATT